MELRGRSAFPDAKHRSDFPMAFPLNGIEVEHYPVAVGQLAYEVMDYCRRDVGGFRLIITDVGILL